MATTKGTKNKKVQATEAAATLDAVRDLDLNTVIGEVGNLQVSVQNALANLSASLTSKIHQMDTVDQAIGLKESRLKELYDIEAEAVGIDELRAQREIELSTWEKRLADRRQQWSDEDAERERFRKRETEEYAYSTKQNQKRVKDEFEAEVSRAKRDEQIRQELLNREWQIREDAIASRENEFVALKEQVANFDAKVKAEVGKAEAIVGNTLKKQYEHEMALLRKDVETERKMNSANVAMLQSTITGLHDQIRDLQGQLAAARADAKEVASQALISASGRQSLEAVQRFVETREPSPKTK